MKLFELITRTWSLWQLSENSAHTSTRRASAHLPWAQRAPFSLQWTKGNCGEKLWHSKTKSSHSILQGFSVRKVLNLSENISGSLFQKHHKSELFFCHYEFLLLLGKKDSLIPLNCSEPGLKWNISSLLTLPLRMAHYHWVLPKNHELVKVQYRCEQYHIYFPYQDRG